MKGFNMGMETALDKFYEYFDKPCTDNVCFEHRQILEDEKKYVTFSIPEKMLNCLVKGAAL